MDRTLDTLVPLLHPINYQVVAGPRWHVASGGRRVGDRRWRRGREEGDDYLQFDYRPEGSQESRKVLLNDHDRIWVAYRYEHILTTTGWVVRGE